MKAEVSLPALFGWLAAMLHNPNNTSRESSRVGPVIETEAVAMLATMVGYDPAVTQGHFTSGGTVANFEAVWRARYRLDHWLSLGLYVAEITGEVLHPFASAHMGWDQFRTLRREHGLTDERLRGCSAASGRDYLGPVMLVPATNTIPGSRPPICSGSARTPYGASRSMIRGDSTSMISSGWRGEPKRRGVPC